MANEKFSEFTVGNIEALVGIAPNVDPLVNYKNSTIQVISNNVGIGTATPTQKLDVVGGLLQVESDGADNLTTISSNGTSVALSSNNAAAFQARELTISDSAVTLNWDDSNLSISRITLNSAGIILSDNSLAGDGYVGVGTAAPAKKLHVKGTMRFEDLPAYADDAAAGGGGLVAGDVYQTTGGGSAPLNAAGIVMIKQ